MNYSIYFSPTGGTKKVADILTANGKKFSVAPDIKFEGPITDDLTFYASATGGNRLNTFTTISSTQIHALARRWFHI